MAHTSGGARIIVILFAIALATFLLAPLNIGPVREYRFMHYMKEAGILTDHRTTEQLIDMLQSPDLRVQVEALMVMSRRDPPDPVIVKVLRQYIDGKNAHSLKNVAIYALGELRIRECLPQLESRVGDPLYDQENLSEAIGKIKGRIAKPWWK